MAVTPVTIDNLPTLTINGLNVANSIDATNDYLPIYTASATATQGINRNTLLGLSSAPVGLTDSQTLTNKTLTNPTIAGATLSGTLSGTYTLGGTPTFPNTVVTTTGSQTLTNKTLTSPTVTGATLTNATITSDSISGYTTSSNGTIYGISVTGGQIGNAALAANAVNTTQITSGIQLPDKMKNPYKFMAYLSANQTIGTTLVKVTLNAKNFDTNSNFDAVTNNRFTAPIAGFYQFGWAAYINAGTSIVSLLYKNGAQIARGSWTQYASSFIASSGSVVLQLAANDYIELWAAGSASTTVVGSAVNDTYLSGFLVSAT